MTNFMNTENEILEINNITFNIMPSDISMYSDNAIKEEIYYRSKGAFAFRSKHSKSKINLTFPIPLLDSNSKNTHSADELELFNNGLRLVGQLNSHPFCYVRSARICSYLGVSFKNDSDLLMFGVEELQLVQDQRVPGVMFLEVSLLFHNHINLVQSLDFDPKEEPFNSFINSLGNPATYRYLNLMRELDISNPSTNFGYESSVTNVQVKVPYISGVDDLKVTDNGGALVLDILKDDVSSIEYKDFKMFDKFTTAETTFDGGILQNFQGDVKDDMAYLKNPSSVMYDWRAYYLEDKNIFNNKNNTIQSVTVTKSNIFASHHLGSSQHPYLQYMGKVPARVSITSVFNSSGSYNRNEQSTYNLFRVMLNTVDSNNLKYPGANSVNFLKLNTAATSLLGVSNFIPGECALSSSSDTSNLETFQTTFIENSMDKVVEESKVRSGKDIVNSTSMINASVMFAKYIKALNNSLKTKEELDFNFHMKVFRIFVDLYDNLLKERKGGHAAINDVLYELNSKGEKISKKEEFVTVKTPGASFKDSKGEGIKSSDSKYVKGSSEYYAALSKQNPGSYADKKQLLLQLIPVVSQIVSRLRERESINNIKSGKTEPEDLPEKYLSFFKVEREGKNSETKSILDVYTFDVRVNELTQQAYFTITASNDETYASLKELYVESLGARPLDVSAANDVYLNNFSGETQKDLNMESYEPNENIRRKKEPFFYLEGRSNPYLSAEDFTKAHQLLSGDIFKALKEAVTREVKTGVLKGSSSHAQNMFSELEALKEKRYSPVAEGGSKAPKSAFDSEFDRIAAQNGYANQYEVDSNLGVISAKYEGKVESANTDNLGSSYGKYQFNTGKDSRKSLSLFFQHAPEYKAKFGDLRPGTEAFNKRWRLLAAQDRAGFEAAQNRAAKAGWYDPAAAYARSVGFKMESRGVQEAIFSASIQHGRVEEIIQAASQVSGFKGMSASDQITIMYGKRVNFVQRIEDTKPSMNKPALYKRYASEVKDALALANKTSVKAASEPSTRPDSPANRDSRYTPPAPSSKIPTAADPKKTTTFINASSNSQANMYTSGQVSKVKLKQANYTVTSNLVSRDVVIKSIIDADTITVYDTKSKLTYDVRSAAIDAPEVRKDNSGTNQFYGPEGVNVVKKLIKVGDKAKVLSRGKIDPYGRMVGWVQSPNTLLKPYNGLITDYLIAEGFSLASPNSPAGIKLQAAAQKASKGMWKEPDRVVRPDAFRAAVKGNTNAAGDPINTNAAVTPQVVESLNKANSGIKTNNIVPLDKSKAPYVIAGSGATYGWRSSSRPHHGLDITSAKGKGAIKRVKVFAPAAGVALGKFDSGDTSLKTGGGRYVELKLYAKGFTCWFMHLDEFAPGISRGKYTKVKKGDFLGYVGTTGASSGYHLHYQVMYNGVPLHPFFTSDLNTIPQGAIDPRLYIHPDAYVTKGPARKGQFFSASARKASLNLVGSGGGLSATGELNGLQDYANDLAGEPQRVFTPEEIRGYVIQDTNVIPSVSVYDDDLKFLKHRDKMFSNTECGLNISFPIIKGYVTVGNEDDETYYKNMPLRPSTYFDLPIIQEFHLATNNDFNPVDICTFSIMNPSSLRSLPEDFGLSSAAKNVANIDTQYYSIFFGGAIKVKPGMKIHIRGGYSNDPNNLYPMFNGVVKEVSGQFDAKLDLVCESYGTELINNTMGFAKPEDMSKRKNASTGLLIGYSLLEPNINHFGAQLSKTRAWWEWIASIFPSFGDTNGDNTVEEFFDGKEDSLIGGKGRAGDFRDPENKALVSPLDMGNFLWNVWNPSRANLAQRLYTNIYSDAIEHVHNQYKSTFWQRYSAVTSWDTEVYYSYWVFRSNTWSVIKEMEYRHPGTLAKPLWYEERQTMFFGTKEQLYVARDLDPAFMNGAGESVRYTDLTKPFTAAYMEERSKRLEPATGFHLLSSKLNIIDNNMGFSRSFATKINVIHYDDKYDGNEVQADSEEEIVELDKGLKAYDIRDKTIALNGCNGPYLAWMYGIQELKKQLETMYVGSITVTGKADMRAGDYAYLEDTDRGLSGIIKIRECEHHYSGSSGYITTITPGLFVECTQFLWDTFFIHMGMASKIALMKSDLIYNSILTENQVAMDYVEYLKVIQGTQSTSAVDVLFGVGGAAGMAGISMFLAYNMLKSSSIFGVKPLGQAFQVASKMSAELYNYGRGSLSARMAATNAARRGLMAATSNSYYRAVATIESAGGSIRWAINPNDRLVRIGTKAVRAFRALGKMPASFSKFIALRSVSTVIGGIATSALKLKSIFIANPLGIILTVIAELAIGFVVSKFKKLELTHNPLLLFPVNYSGKPYVAGISGFTNKGVLDNMIQNIETNLIDMRKAQAAMDSASGAQGVGGAAALGLGASITMQSGIADAAKALSDFFKGG